MTGQRWIALAAMAMLWAGSPALAEVSVIPVPGPSGMSLESGGPWGVRQTGAPPRRVDSAAKEDEPSLAQAAEPGASESGLDFKGYETPLPEIPIWAMLLIGFAGLGLGFRKRRNRAARCHVEDSF